MSDEFTEQRDAKGRMLAQLPGAKPFTKTNAREMANRRWEAIRKETVKRITEDISAIDAGVKTPAEAFAFVASKQVMALVDSEKPRIDQLVKLGLLMTGREESRGASMLPNPGARQISASADELHRLIGMIEQDKTDAVARARAVDAVIIPPVDVIDIRNDNESNAE